MFHGRRPTLNVVLICENMITPRYQGAINSLRLLHIFPMQVPDAEVRGCAAHPNSPQLGKQPSDVSGNRHTRISPQISEA